MWDPVSGVSMRSSPKGKKEVDEVLPATSPAVTWSVPALIELPRTETCRPAGIQNRCPPWPF